MAHQDEISDFDLVQAYRGGDQAALSDLVERYRQRLFGFICKMTGNRQEAEDIFQEVWLRIVRNIDRYVDRCFGAWLFRIARNLIIDRQRTRREEISLNSNDNFGVALQDRMDDGRPSPARQAESSEMHRQVSAAVRALPPEQREVFLMRMEGDLSFKEIARIQKVSINTALARMQYAIAKLKTILSRDDA